MNLLLNWALRERGGSTPTRGCSTRGGRLDPDTGLLSEGEAAQAVLARLLNMDPGGKVDKVCEKVVRGNWAGLCRRSDFDAALTALRSGTTFVEYVVSIAVKAPPAGSSGSGAGSASPPPAARDLRAAYEAFCVLSGVVPPADWEGLVACGRSKPRRSDAARAASAIVGCRCRQCRHRQEGVRSKK